MWSPNWITALFWLRESCAVSPIVTASSTKWMEVRYHIHKWGVDEGFYMARDLVCNISVCQTHLAMVFSIMVFAEMFFQSSFHEAMWSVNQTHRVRHAIRRAQSVDRLITRLSWAPGPPSSNTFERSRHVVSTVIVNTPIQGKLDWKILLYHNVAIKASFYRCEIWNMILICCQTHTCTHTYTHMHTHTYTYTHTHIHIHIHNWHKAQLVSNLF